MPAPITLKRITNELGGVRETENRRAIDDNFQAIGVGFSAISEAVRASNPSHQRRPLFPAIGSDVPTLATTGPGGPTPIAGSVLVPRTSTDIRLIGCVPAVVSALGTDYTSNASNGTTGSGATVSAIEFEGYVDDFAIVFRNGVSGQSTFWVWATDPSSGEFRPTTAAPVLSSAAAPNSLHYQRVTFGSLAQRQVRVYLYQADFGGIYVKPTQCIGRTAPHTRKLCVVTDSFGAGALDVAQMMTWPNTLARMLGVELFLNAVGGTGFAAVNGGLGGNNNFSAAPRVSAALLSGASDFLIVGSTNDFANSTDSVVSSATSLVDQLKSGLPASRIWMSGVPGVAVSAASTGNNAANNTALSSFAAGRGIPFIDTLTTWFSGTGKVGATTGNGARDTMLNTDGIHPSQAGQNYIAARKYQELLNLGW